MTKTGPSPQVEELLNGIKAQDRRALGKAITLFEDDRADRRADADALLTALVPMAGASLRIAISGPPGVGKSTFIEAVGKKLVADKRRVAVLAVDPSSPVSGGSILGDRTRMDELSRSDAAFIRPSPSRNILGGVARRTREAIIACEAFGHDVVFIETVGVGQSEFVAHGLCDVFVLLHQPGAGDELQGLKRGILELADLVVVNKCDGERQTAAKLAKSQLDAALSVARSDDERPPILMASAAEGVGLNEFWQAVLARQTRDQKSGAFTKRRQEQLRAWFQEELQQALVAAVAQDKSLAGTKSDLEAKVLAGKMPATAAASELATRLLKGRA